MRSTLGVGLEVALALGLSVAAAVLLTWPMPAHTHQIVVGGGELGGWLWRSWWHFTEAEALSHADQPLLERLTQLVALGRHPETGNILDVLFLSWPLSRWLDFPADYNVKVLLILSLDGLCAYALARHFTRSRSASLAAALVAVVNPLNIQDVNGSGLRQCLLWWLLLYPIFLDRAARGRRWTDAVLAGLTFGLCASWYWFYGIFAGVFSAAYLVWHLADGTLSWRALHRWLLPLSLVALLTAWPFVRPYLNSAEDGAAALPEMSFFLPFPRYETIAEAPLRPDTYEENVLASLHRSIRSSWAADFLVRPTLGERAWPFAVVLLGALPALIRRKRLFWLAVFLFFYAAALGPFLKLDTMAEADVVTRLGGHWVVRMPFTWLFRWVPGMSRLFGPYRLSSVLVVASVVLLAGGLGDLPAKTWRGRWGRRLLSGGCILATCGQVLYRWQVDYVPGGAMAPNPFRAPVKVSRIDVPEFYRTVDSAALRGIIELPLGREQDLLCYYQTIHHQKVFRSWASQGAIPTLLMRDGGGAEGARLRYLAAEEGGSREAADVLQHLSSMPEDVPLSDIDPVLIAQLAEASGYRYLIVHERGYYLVDPYSGPVQYRDAVRRIAAGLSLTPEEVVEHRWVDYPGNQYNVPGGPVYVPWTAEEILLLDRQMPRKLYMSIFDLDPLLAAVGAGAPSGEDAAGEEPQQDVETPADTH
ncbi:MAG: hypothetical protein ABIO70_30120 [Pseudomonadota bacterium]